MSSSLLTHTAMAAEASNLPMPTVGYGVVSISILIFLLLVTMAFRSYGTRVRDK
ncbi:MAG TPA: hypothetical protein VK063_12680 [Beutenbergiaceae bacterium]|nr:hypothetical protein [Beutenbergiaceae bacterium]